jgi:hypothetical protein
MDFSLNEVKTKIRYFSGVTRVDLIILQGDFKNMEK